MMPIVMLVKGLTGRHVKKKKPGAVLATPGFSFVSSVDA
jgi:hypothetical protein